MQSLGTLGGGNSFGLDINNNGHIVGNSGNTAFRSVNGVMTAIDPGNNGSANDLNELDEAVGTRVTSENTLVIWNSANNITTPYPFSNFSGVANNDNGELVDDAEGIGFFSSGSGPITALGSLVPTDINNSRLITGSIGIDAILYDKDSNTTITIPKLISMTETARAMGLNEAGTVVGQSGGRGFVYTTSGGIVDLSLNHYNEYGPWNILSASNINNHGWIVGTAYHGTGPSRTVILVPETLADFDEDGDVDGRDFLRWQRGETPENGSPAELALWQAQYGTKILSALVVNGLNAVPEPASVTLMVVMFFTIISRRVSSRWLASGFWGNCDNRG